LNIAIKENDRAKMCAESKIGLLATIDEKKSPHISFISSIQPHGNDQLIAGQFCAGLSKKFILERPETGFLIFTPEMEIWRGRAYYQSSAESGPEYDMYNQRPLFRYNSYFGIGLVHYFRLIDITAREHLTRGKIARGALKTRIMRPFLKSDKMGVLNKLSSNMFDELDGLKFIAYLDQEGYPLLVPVIQATNAGRDRIIFSFDPFRESLQSIPNGAAVAIFFINLKMESVLVKGYYKTGNRLLKYGSVEIERVYNSMPPQPQYIYPKENEHKKVTVF